MNISIVGAGNIGTQFAVHCAEKGHRVTVFGSRPNEISKEICIVDENNAITHSATIYNSTDVDEIAFLDAQLVFVTVPAYCMNDIAKKIERFANCDMNICLVPGTGGGECAFKTCIEKGATIFGLQRVPSVARLIEYGKTVRAIGYRDELFVASLPAQNVSFCANVIESIFDIKCTAMPNFLNLTLTPSNPILHTTRLKKLFEDYEDNCIYERVPLFYEEWDDKSSELLFACDSEVQELCKAINMFDLSYVKSLRIHYESDTPEELTKKISGIAGFKGLTSPTIQIKGGFIPDLKSRYFTADFPYGLAILVQIAELMNVQHQNMQETLEWYYKIAGNVKMFRFSDYGIETKEQLIDFYSL